MASFTTPPSYNFLKRKRIASASSEGYYNPLSHPPHILRQFAVAGLAETETLPSLEFPQFPHRALPAQSAEGASAPVIKEFWEKGHDDSDEDDDADPSDASGRRGRRRRRSSAMTSGDDDDEEGAARLRLKRQKSVERKNAAYEHHLGMLRGVILRSLDEGQIARAKRAFGLVLRTRIKGLMADLRRDYWWALGAEILMREGEDEDGASVMKKDKKKKRRRRREENHQVEEEDEEGPRHEQDGRHRRWGNTANARRVREYYQDLIQLFPYDRQWHARVSALTFWPVMMGVEMYDIYEEARAANARADEEAAGQMEEVDEDNDMVLDESDDDGGGGTGSGYSAGARGRLQKRLKDRKEEIRLEAMDRLREVARRMDLVMEDLPYSTSHEMLRLRAMVSLYTADLSMSTAPRTDLEEHEGITARQAELERAKDKFRLTIKHGGEVEEWIEYFVYPERRPGVEYENGDEGEKEEEEDWKGLSLFSSLPIREPGGLS